MLAFEALSSNRATERLKSGNGTDARAFTRILTTTSGLYTEANSFKIARFARQSYSRLATDLMIEVFLEDSDV
jgi:hypothetical protein